IARMFAKCAHIRVREDDRLRREIQYFARGPIARVRTAHDHSDALHFSYHAASKLREAAVIVLATSAKCVVSVVRDQHPANAQIVVQRDHVQLPAESHPSLKIECHSKLPLRLGAMDALDVGDEAEAVGMCTNPVAELSYLPHVRFDTRDV